MSEDDSCPNLSWLPRKFIFQLLVLFSICIHHRLFAQKAPDEGALADQVLSNLLQAVPSPNGNPVASYPVDC